MEFQLFYGDDPKPFMLLTAASIDSVPTSIRQGPAGLAPLGYARELAAIDASVLAIASRMGSDVLITTPDGDLNTRHRNPTDSQETLADALARARAAHESRPRRRPHQ